MIHSHHHSILESLPQVDPLHWAGFVAIFSYSFLMSWHCAGMCGPLACSVLARTHRPSWMDIGLYNLGRLLSYVGAGALMGFFALQLAQISLAAGLIMSRVIGVGLVVWALWPKLPVFKSIPLGRKFTPLGLGLITLFLPCMTLHPLLLASAGTGHPLPGALSMLAFYLGTLPVMVTATYVPTFMSKNLPRKALTYTGRGLLALAGLITVYRSI